MKKIAIITARGGSKRIPSKNIKTFCGKPIIYHVIKIAINSKIFDEVMVSTDSEKIAEISRTNGASVPFMRSKNNSDDYSTTPDVLYEVLNEYKKNGIKFDIACCIYPTAVLIEKSILKRSLDLLKKNSFDTVLSSISKFYFLAVGFKIKQHFTFSLLNMNKNVNNKLNICFSDGAFICAFH